MRLLLTRPEPDNERTASLLGARGHEVIRAPLLRIESIANADLGPPPFGAILLTSANGAWAIADHPRRGELLRLPVLTVGRGSAEAARAAGFSDVVSADGDASDLARLAVARFAGRQRPLLYLAGEDRARDLSGDLALQDAPVRTIVVYRATKATEYPPPVRAALEQGRIDGVLHFSRRSVEAYLECGGAMTALVLAPAHYCLSARAAEPLRAAGAALIHVATEPSEARLLALVAPQG
jgi:uroporphyrinogen-III synthase